MYLALNFNKISLSMMIVKQKEFITVCAINENYNEIISLKNKFIFLNTLNKIH